MSDSVVLANQKAILSNQGEILANQKAISANQNVAITPVTLTATGGTGTGYTFMATGLPTGLSISASGVISGTPTVQRARVPR